VWQLDIVDQNHPTMIETSKHVHRHLFESQSTPNTEQRTILEKKETIANLNFK
jgi:hypothetical protein